MKDPLDILDSVQKAETPPFLYTRILNKIQVSRQNKLTPQFALGFALSFILLLSLNIQVFKSNKTDTATEIAQTMNLFSNNTLYR